MPRSLQLESAPADVRRVLKVGLHRQGAVERIGSPPGKGIRAVYQKLNHPDGDDYENWLAAEQAAYYREVIA